MYNLFLFLQLFICYLTGVFDYVRDNEIIVSVYFDLDSIFGWLFYRGACSQWENVNWIQIQSFSVFTETENWEKRPENDFERAQWNEIGRNLNCKLIRLNKKAIENNYFAAHNWI